MEQETSKSNYLLQINPTRVLKVRFKMLPWQKFGGGGNAATQSPENAKKSLSGPHFAIWFKY
jgi:hypothetical protein